jgi:hypothetical protein
MFQKGNLKKDAKEVKSLGEMGKGEADNRCSQYAMLSTRY